MSGASASCCAREEGEEADDEDWSSESWEVKVLREFT